MLDVFLLNNLENTFRLFFRNDFECSVSPIFLEGTCFSQRVLLNLTPSKILKTVTKARKLVYLRKNVKMIRAFFF